jgi:CRP-like cAMP-binding protein
LARVGASGPATNRLLDRLPAKDCARVLAACEEVELSIATILDEPGEAISHVYFPTNSFVSLITPMGGKKSLEVALAGSEGIYGIPVALGVGISPVHALVQGGGAAWRMDPEAFRAELAQIPALRACIDRYIYVSMSQLIQNAACNRFHVVEQRVARWLLMTSDRAHSASFFITHEFLAHILGVRRVGITEAASALQSRNLIDYTRGAMTIRDRRGLERAACPCYRSDLNTYDRILG